MDSCLRRNDGGGSPPLDHMQPRPQVGTAPPAHCLRRNDGGGAPPLDHMQPRPQGGTDPPCPLPAQE